MLDLSDFIENTLPESNFVISNLVTRTDNGKATVTSQNVSSEAQANVFLFFRKVVFRSQEIKVFVFLTTSWFTKSVTSWWVLHETGYIFEYIFWNTTHWITKLGQPIDISKGNNFQESFEQFGGMGSFSI